MTRAEYVVVRNPAINPNIESPDHVVNGTRWLEVGDPPRTRCQKRVGARWRVVAATSKPSQIIATDSCPACVRTFRGNAGDSFSGRTGDLE